MLSSGYIERSGLEVHVTLVDFLEREALAGTGVTKETFWATLSELVHTMGPRNQELLDVRDVMQAAIDEWHRSHRAQRHDHVAYRAFLADIGYLVPEGDQFEVSTTGIDREMTEVAGPQLVVPLTNARYALNAANARWGSLYDALYGTDALGDRPTQEAYDPARGDRVVAWVRQFLDDVVPLDGRSHADVSAYRVQDGHLFADGVGTRQARLRDPARFAGHCGPAGLPSCIVLVHHGLHIMLQIDRSTEVGAVDRAGVSDVVIESAVTTIMDLEDSVATVDAGDKVAAYRNWLGLMKGDLSEEVIKGPRRIVRRLDANRRFIGPDGTERELPGRALMLARNVGHLMTTPAVRDRDGAEAFEGLLDALVSVTLALHDRNRPLSERNSRTGSVYVVKPKMHGPDEVAFTNDVFTLVERALGLPDETVKIGIMDEERRTSVNLQECIRAVKRRVAFINTGFLDRTGDEIHTSMEAGPMVRKADMKSQPWIRAYEDWNVDVGLACGLHGRAQIGKGMWAAPDLMGDMLEVKIGHVQAGASCAWVPSPTAATLHATHYHRVDAFERQRELMTRARATFDDLLTIPVVGEPRWSDEDRRAEVANNAQGILGYVVRWVGQGIGCSKVPDINDVALMEDRATCRISSQHIANWLRHGVVTAREVDAILREMAAVVDRQNEDDPSYVPMAPAFDSPPFLAARELIFSGTSQPSGYTEPILHAQRLAYKAETSR